MAGLAQFRLTLNRELNYSVDRETFDANPDVFRYYTSPDHVCLLRRLVLYPFSLRELLRTAIDTNYWTIANPEPKNGERDDDEAGELAFAHDCAQIALRVNDRTLFLFTFYQMLAIDPVLLRLFCRYSNIYKLRCAVAFIRYAIRQLRMLCIEPVNAGAVLDSFVAAVFDIVVHGKTTVALYTEFMGNYYLSCEALIQRSHPGRFTDADLPPDYVLFASRREDCGFYRTPWEPATEKGLKRVREMAGLSDDDELVMSNSGGSAPRTEAEKYARLAKFVPERLLTFLEHALPHMRVWDVVNFSRTFNTNFFRTPDAEDRVRTLRAALRVSQQAMYKKRARREEEE